MASNDMNAQTAADDAAVEKMRERFGDAEAAKFAASIYLKRIGGSSVTNYGFGQFPRGVVILIALWVGLLETADKLPKLLLTVPQYEATLAEYHAKLLQPDLTAAQLEKAKQDAKASQFQPDIASTQLEKSKYETKAAVVQPDLAASQLEKAKQDAKASAFQPALVAGQAFKAEVDAEAAGGTLDPESGIRLGNMFDLLDPNHPHMTSRGMISPDMTPLMPLLYKAALEKLQRDEEESERLLLAALKANDRAAITSQIIRQIGFGNYQKALEAAKQMAALTEQREGRPGEQTSTDLAYLSWCQLLTKEFDGAYSTAYRAISINPGNTFAARVEAHALLFLGKIDSAMLIYTAHRGESVNNRPWEQAVSDDFDQLAKAGVTSSRTAEVKAKLSN